MKWFDILKALSPEERAETERFWPEEDLAEHTHEFKMAYARLYNRLKVEGKNRPPTKKEIYAEMKNPSGLRTRGRPHWLTRAGIGFGEDEAESRKRAKRIRARLFHRKGKIPNLKEIKEEWLNPGPKGRARLPKPQIIKPPKFGPRNRTGPKPWYVKAKVDIKGDTERSTRVLSRARKRHHPDKPTLEQITEEWNKPSKYRPRDALATEASRAKLEPISELIVSYGSWALQNNIPLKHLENFIVSEEGRELTDKELIDVKRWKKQQGG